MTQVGLHRPVWEPPHSTEAEPEAGDGMVALGKLTVYSLAAGPSTIPSSYLDATSPGQSRTVWPGY